MLLAAGVCYGVAAQQWIVGSATGGWVYPYIAAYDARLVRMFARIAVGALLLLAIPVNSRTAWKLAIVWMLAATVAHWHLRTRAPIDVERMFLSPGANSFYTLAQQRRPGEILADFEQVRLEAPMHAQSNLPGKTLLVHALEMVSTRTDVLPWLLVILSNLGALLIFALARELFSDDRVALYAAVLYLFTPARVFFFPLMNAVTPVFVLLFAAVTVRWCDHWQQRVRRGGRSRAVRRSCSSSRCRSPWDCSWRRSDSPPSLAVRCDSGDGPLSAAWPSRYSWSSR